MDKKKSILNVTVAIGFKVATMVAAVVARRLLIQVCGNEINGLNALYLSIIGFLAVAELGIGSAITFCMYKPIVQGETDKVAALYRLFRKCYLLVGAVIFVAGLAITPFIRYFAKDYAQLDVNFSVTFFLMLLSVVITYLFGAKTALINAYKNNYITTAINSGGMLLQYGLQILVLLLTGSFEAYLLCRIIVAIIQWGITEGITRTKYPKVLRLRARVDPDTKAEVTKNIRAMFMHKIGSLLVTTVDSLVISVFIGVAVLGEYINYTTILDYVAGILILVFSSLTSIFGHMYIREDRQTTKRVAERLHTLNFCIGTVVYLGYFAVVDSLIAIIFGENLVVDRMIVLVITMNGFVSFQRKSALVFREATGTFYYDRWKPLFEGTANLILSVLFVNWFGVTGVILATIITNLLICHIVEPYVLYKHAFHTSPVSYYVRNYAMIAVFAVALAVMNSVFCVHESHWKTFFVNGCASVIISTFAIILVLLFSGIIKELKNNLAV